MSQSTVSYLWREPAAAVGYATGVSLHSHTNQSVETLDFLADISRDVKIIQPLMSALEERCARTSAIKPDYASAYWTPPLTPRLAFELERDQIQNQLQVPGLVSLSDHDDIKAPMLLRSVDSARHIPVSLEWTVPYGAPTDRKPTAFHLGIHNLPSASASEWMARLAAFTATPLADRPVNLLGQMLEDLDSEPGVLIVFNHPLWDLYRIGADAHNVYVNEFLAVHGQFIHALELNGLRNWSENKQVTDLAQKWNQLVISGGDRHGVEPNANVNLTHATSFTAFVHEVRKERISNVLFMPQYAQPWKYRILQSTLDAIRNYPHFPVGSRRWDERAYHPGKDGTIQPFSALWVDGRPPVYLSVLVASVRLLGYAPFSGGLRRAWNDEAEMHAVLGSLDS